MFSEVKTRKQVLKKAQKANWKVVKCHRGAEDIACWQVEGKWLPNLALLQFSLDTDGNWRDRQGTFMSCMERTHGSHGYVIV